MLDSIINEFDKALKVLTVDTPAQRTRPDVDIKDSLSLTSKERKKNGELKKTALKSLEKLEFFQNNCKCFSEFAAGLVQDESASP